MDLQLSVVWYPVGRWLLYLSCSGPTSYLSLPNKFLVANAWLSKFIVVTFHHLDRVMSHHFPLALSSSSIDWGPCPFHFENSWLQIPFFHALVENWWTNIPLLVGLTMDWWRNWKNRHFFFVIGRKTVTLRPGTSLPWFHILPLWTLWRIMDSLIQIRFPIDDYSENIFEKLIAQDVYWMQRCNEMEIKIPLFPLYFCCP